MNILITGSNGLIGKSLTDLLIKNNNKVINLDKNTFKKNTNKKKLEIIKLDILNKKKLLSRLKNKKLDMVIHLAAFLGVKKTEESEVKCLDVNIDGTRNVLELSKLLKVKRIIFASSSEIYGAGYKKLMKEADQPTPKSSYGISKVVGEAYVKAYYQKHNIEYNILRFFNIYGRDQRDDFVISKFVNNIKRNKDLNIYGNGKQIRCFCHINDAVFGIHSVIKKGKKNTIYNIGNNFEPISILNLAKKIKNISGKEVKIKKIPFSKSDRSLKREIFYRKPDISKIMKHTDYRPKTNLRIGLLEMF